MNLSIAAQHIRAILLFVLLSFTVSIVKAQPDTTRIEKQEAIEAYGGFFGDKGLLEQPKGDATTINYLETGEIAGANNKGTERSIVVGSTAGSASVSPSGAATYQIPIFTLPGTGGMQPSISLVYSSQSGNGILGMGWNLSGLSAITRVPQTGYQDGAIKGISITNNDRFALDGNRLYATSGSNGVNNTSYVTEVADFSMIYSYGVTSQGPTWFKVITKAGNIVEYGNSTTSKYLLEGNSTVFTWYISKVTNPNGQYMTFHYTQGTGEITLDRIEYTGAAGITPYNTIRFTYETRPDIVVSYIAGAKATKSKRLKFVTVEGEGHSIRKYEMDYAANGPSYLVSVKEHGLLNLSTLNPTTFEWEGQGENKFESLDPNNSMWSTAFGLKDGWNESIYPRLTGDVDGDGLEDIVGFGHNGVSFHKSTGTGFVHAAAINTGHFTYGAGWILPNHPRFLSDVNGDGKLDIVGFNQQGVWVSFFNGTDFTTPVLKIADFGWDYQAKSLCYMADVNGDGRADVVGFGWDGVWVALSEGTAFGTKKRWCANFGYNADVGGWQADKYPRLMADVNGDGMADIVGFGHNGVGVAISNGISEFTISPQWGIAAFGYAAEVGGWRVEAHPRMMADVNGDGLADIVGFGGYGVGVALSTGNGFILADQMWSSEYGSEPTAGGWQVKKYPRYLADVNGDGLADIVGFSHTGVSVSLSTGSNFVISEPWSTDFGYNNWPNEEYNRTLADVNGDGMADLVCFGYYGSYAQVSAKKPINQLSSITTGMGHTTNFTYDFITNNTVYQKQNDAVYPITDFQGPIQVVKSLEASNGIGANTSITTYTYSGAKIHRLGKGFLGFMGSTTSNADLNTQTTSVYELKTAMNYSKKGLVYHTCLKSQSVAVGSQVVSKNTLTNQTKVTIRNNHFPYVSNSSQYNATNNTTITKAFTYNTNGNATSIVTNFDNDATETVTNTYVLAGGNGNTVPNRLSNTSVTKTIGNSPSFTQSQSISYDTKGNVLQSSNGLQTTVHVLNSMGLPESTTVSANGESRTQSFLYDSKYRFVTQVENAQGHKVTYTYDSPTALRLSTTGIDGKTTYFAYDGFLRPDASQNPLGTITTTLNWANGNGPANTVYYKEVTTTDRPTSKVYYDLLGRELRTESEHLNGTLLSDNIYNYKGQLEYSSSAYFINSPAKWTTILYDDFGRQISSSYNGQTTSITYSGKTVTTTAPDGTNSIKTYNAAGNLMTSQDNGGTITYTYHGSGQPLSISYSGGSTTTMEYDSYGRQTKLNDPSAGPTTYGYNGFSEITSQADARGNSYQMAYDNLGRITSKTGPAAAISYTYVQSGNGKGQLYQESNAANATSTTYTYDGFGRATAIAESVDGQVFTTFFAFDQYGNNTQQVYPSGYTLDYGYYKGTLTSITEAATQTAVWNYSAETALGQPKQYKLHNGTIVVDYSYDGNDMLSQIKTGAISDFGYAFNPTTGNLTYRRDNVRNLQEDFTYDNLNRLKTISSPAQQLTMSYASNGNILDKGLGTFTYDGNKLTGINPLSAQTPSSYLFNQAITYTPFNKVETVTQGSYLYSIKYGTDNQRVKSELKQGTTVKKTVYYVGSYEKETTPSGTREIHYISSPYGVVAAAIKQNGASILYYLATDHLGSVTEVFSPNGTVAERNSYDAWGRRRNSTNWSYTLEPIRDRIISRGFTFHEHLDEFSLINMNGRVYDPILGRFLSPDPYVQAPDFTQSFNRYSYCVNNPLSFVDPSGEKFTFWHHASAIFFGAASWSGIYKHATGQATIGEAAGEYAVNVAAFLVGAYAGNAASAATTLEGFLGGAITGAAGGASGGFVGGAGNAWVYGANFTDGLNKGLVAGGIGLVSGGVIGGVIGGVDARMKGMDFWDGDIPIEQRLEAIKNSISDEIWSKNEIGDIIVGKNMGDASGRCTQGIAYKSENGEVKFTENTIKLTRSTIRKIYSGKSSGFETLRHEIFHSADYSSGEYWRVFIGEGRNVELTRCIMEQRAFFNSFLNTGSDLYLQLTRQWWDGYFLLFVK